MTLPSRLKTQNRSLQRLDEFENALNINGNQNIAKLRMSIEKRPGANEHSQPSRLEISAQSKDTRLPSQQRESNESRDLGKDDLQVFDMNLFPEGDEIHTSRGRDRSKRTHVFGQLESIRGNEDFEGETEADEDDGTLRARQRAAGLPLVHK
jgi:hypothetical protein